MKKLFGAFMIIITYVGLFWLFPYFTLYPDLHSFIVRVFWTHIVILLGCVIAWMILGI